LERITPRITFVQVITNKTTKMEQNYTSKTDKIVRIVIYFAIVAIALGVAYTWHLHHIKQFGN
jgi:polyferredoxin